MPEPLCHCGKKLHYTPDNKHTQYQIEEIAKRFGHHIDVTQENGKTYRVQRHYIALHGIKNKDLAELGFKEVK